MTWLRRRRSRCEGHTDGVMGCRPQFYVLLNLPPTPRALEMPAAIKAMPMEGCEGVDTARRHHRDHFRVTTRTEERSLVGVGIEKCVVYLCTRRGVRRPCPCRRVGCDHLPVHQERRPPSSTAIRRSRECLPIPPYSTDGSSGLRRRSRPRQAPPCTRSAVRHPRLQSSTPGVASVVHDCNLQLIPGRALLPGQSPLFHRRNLLVPGGALLRPPRPECRSPESRLNCYSRGS
jgi:hypothetical protein